MYISCRPTKPAPTIYNVSARDLRRHSDSVPPGTSFREIVDRCRVWENHSNESDHHDMTPTFTGTRFSFTGPRSGKPVVPVAMVDASDSHNITPTITGLQSGKPLVLVDTPPSMESTEIELPVRELLLNMPVSDGNSSP